MARSIVGELRELQYTLAGVAYKLRSRLGMITDEFLGWYLSVAEKYDGPRRNPEVLERLRKTLAIPEQERRKYDLSKADANQAIGLKEYTLPFVEAHGDISICPLDFQRRVFRVMGQVDLFNQQVRELRAQYDLTFDTSQSPANRQIIEQNLQRGYDRLSENARLIAEDITDIRE